MFLLINVNQPCYNRRANKELNERLIIKDNLLADKENMLNVKDAEIQQLR